MLNVKLRYVNRGVFKGKPNNYGQAFFAKIVELFLQKHSLVDVWLSSKYASGSLDAPCEMAPLNSFIMQYYVITSSSFVFKNENIHSKTFHYWFHKIYTHL